MKFYINKSILAGFIIAMIIIFSLGIGSYLYVNDVINRSRTSLQTEQISLEAEQVLAALSKIENNLIKYSITGDAQHLHAGRNVAMYLRQRLQNLDAMVASDTVQRQRVTQLKTLAEEKIKFYESNDSLALRGQKMKDLIAQVDDMAAIHLVLTIQSEERRIKQDLQEAFVSQFFHFAYVFFGLLFAGLVILVMLTYALNVNMRKRAMTEEKLNLALGSIQDLYDNAPCGYFSINSDGIFTTVNTTLLDWLGYKRTDVIDRLYITNVLKGASVFDNEFSLEKEFLPDIEAEMIRKDNVAIPVILNTSLIQDSKGKTIALRCSLVDNTERKKAEEQSKIANKELEAFSYSVSHDLRSPLRSIHGYSQILFEDYGEKVDDEGRRLIEVVRKSANRMGQLIDDLLDFSRLGRQEISKTKTNMAELTRQIVEELMLNEKDRVVQLNITELSVAEVDPNMIRQVWTNLISNALKYSRKKEAARIDIGSTEDDHYITYFVKDNGAGFNTAYAHKLFGVFQRLHKETEFEGTGVGLALVKRIVNRHHGEIWAESKVNEGSSFYFSIPKS